MNDNDQNGAGFALAADQMLGRGSIEGAIALYQQGAQSLVTASSSTQWLYFVQAGSALFDYAEKFGPLTALNASLNFLEQAHTIAQKTPEADLPITCNHLGKTLLSLGRREGNIDYLSRAQKAFENSLKNWHRGTNLASWARASINLVCVYNSITNIAPKEDEYKTALAIIDDVISHLHRKSPIDEPRALDCRGNILATTGKEADAIESYDKAISMTRDLRLKAGYQVNKGITLSQMGKYQEAVHLFKEALSIQKTHEFPLERGNTLEQMGTVTTQRAHEAYSKGDFQSGGTFLEEARQVFEDSLKFFKREFSPRKWGHCMFNLATTLEVMGGLHSDMPESSQQAAKIYTEAFTEFSQKQQATARQALARLPSAKSGPEVKPL